MYECLVGDSPIMRRCKDDWVNATQILKLCNFPKAKRTKILEKGVQQGQHEKVQGGYGRFQGTWIPLADARRLADEYGITADMVPVLYLDLDDPAMIIPKKSKPPSGSLANKDGTPIKRKYAKKTKKETTPKKMKLDNGLPPQAVFGQDYPPPLSRGGSLMSQVSQTMHLQQQMMAPHMPPTFQLLEFMSNGLMNGSQRLPMNSFQSYNQMPAPVQTYQGMVPQAKQFGNFGPMEETSQLLMYHQHQKGTLSSTNDTNWSQEEHTRDSDTSLSSGDGKGSKVHMVGDNSYASQLLRFFNEDNAPIPYFLYNPPPEFDINEAIDDEGHTTLHWAASIGNLSLAQLLLSKNANALTVSNYGLNPLSKCIAFNNCYDLRNFPLMIDALEMCLINTDINGRTPLHYLCQYLKVKSKLPALSYYLQVIFSKLTAMSNNSKTNTSNLLQIVVDHQDVSGDTCLHIAARAGSTQFVKFLLGQGASADLLNLNNETAKSIIMQNQLLVYNFDSQSNLPNPSFQSHSFQEEHPSDEKRESIQGSGTPVQNFASRRAETPDTQRTTIQDDDDDEISDRVSKEHLQTLLEKQAGTVDDNKENIFLEESFKSSYDSMSTPKHAISRPPSNARQNVLGMIREKVTESTPIPRPSSSHNSHLPNPPQLDSKGAIILSQENFENADVKLPMEDVKSMMHGMINLLSDSYSQELSGLNIEFKKIKSILVEKKDQNKKCIERVNVLLGMNDFAVANLLDGAKDSVEQEVIMFDQELKQKEAQLVCSIEKGQAFELANLVQENESELESQDEEVDNMEERFKNGVELSRAQLQRIELVNKVAESVKNFAINDKMNKYRKLISLSCGLRVEDIDGLIDGIGESLMEGTM